MALFFVYVGVNDFPVPDYADLILANSKLKISAPLLFLGLNTCFFYTGAGVPF